MSTVPSQSYAFVARNFVKRSRSASGPRMYLSLYNGICVRCTHIAFCYDHIYRRVNWPFPWPLWRWLKHIALLQWWEHYILLALQKIADFLPLWDDWVGTWVESLEEIACHRHLQLFCPSVPPCSLPLSPPPKTTASRNLKIHPIIDNQARFAVVGVRIKIASS